MNGANVNLPPISALYLTEIELRVSKKKTADTDTGMYEMLKIRRYLLQKNFNEKLQSAGIEVKG